MKRGLHITIPGLPVAFARSGGNGKVRFTPAKQRAAMAEMKAVAALAMGDSPLFEGPLCVAFAFTWPWPKSVSAKKRAADTSWRTSRPDADNLMKLVADAFNGIVWMDDAQIATASISKVYGLRAETKVVVMQLAGESF